MDLLTYSIILVLLGMGMGFFLTIAISAIVIRIHIKKLLKKQPQKFDTIRTDPNNKPKISEILDESFLQGAKTRNPKIHKQRFFDFLGKHRGWRGTWKLNEQMKQDIIDAPDTYESIANRFNISTGYVGKIKRLAGKRRR